MDMRLVLVTHPNKEHAERITRGVIDAKLAACVLVTDVKSFYNWEGKLNEDDGFEYLEHPEGSSNWYYRQNKVDDWSVWK